MDERMSDDKVEHFLRQLALERFNNEPPYLFHNQRTLWLLDALDAERAHVKKLERMVDVLEDEHKNGCRTVRFIGFDGSYNEYPIKTLLGLSEQKTEEG